jgi:hypothetical protein
MLAMTDGFIWNRATKGLDMIKGKVILLAAFIALPSTANAWSWWSGWDSYAECVDYYTKNPIRVKDHYSDKYVFSLPPEERERYLIPDETCRDLRLKEERERQKQAEINRVLILSCRAESVTEAQFEACVALVMPARR